MKLANIEEKVRDVLERFPMTRDSDDLLYATICMEIDESGAGMPFWYVLQHRKEFDFPNIKSVERARRTIQRKHPELAGTDKVQGFRAVKEQEFRVYARAQNE